MTNRTDPRADHTWTSIGVLVGRNEGPKAEIAWIERSGATWKEAHLENRGETVIATGIAAVHAKLAEMLGEPPVVVLPLHEGYWGMYDGGVLPFARAMRVGDRWSFRRLDVHESVMVDTLEEAVAIAYEAGR